MILFIRKQEKEVVLKCLDGIIVPMKQQKL